MANYFTDEEEELTPLDEEESPAPRPKPRWWEPPKKSDAPPPSLSGDSPIPTESIDTDIPGAMREGPKAVPGRAPVVAEREDTADALAKVKGEKPGEAKPKWWQRLAAGAVGFGAGYVNADGKNHGHIDASGAVDTIMGGPEQRRKLSDWQNKVGGAQARADAAQTKEEGWWKNRQLGRQEDLADAQIAHEGAQTGLVKEQTAALSAGTKDQYLKVGDGIFDKKAGKWKVPPTDKKEMMSVDAVWAKENLPMLSPDEDGKFWVPVKGLDSILSNVTKKDPAAKENEQQWIATLNNPKATPQERAVAKANLDESVRQKKAGAPVSNNVFSLQERRTAAEDVAQGLASGDLVALRGITSMRGNERMMAYAMAKKINPNFNPNTVERKLAMLTDLDNGKLSASLRSFGTFLEHAGAASDAAKVIQQTNPQLLNKPINWWKVKMAGDENFQKFLVSLEPVGKEFESFLLSGRALYDDDRKQIHVLLNPESSMGQALAALNQMGHTAQARFNQENFRFKRLMDKDIPLPFGPEATEGARKIGVALGGQHGGASEYVRTAVGANGHTIGQKSDGGWYDIQTGQKVQ